MKQQHKNVAKKQTKEKFVHKQFDLKLEDKIDATKFDEPITGLALLLKKSVEFFKWVTVSRDREANQWIVEYEDGTKEVHPHVILRDAEFLSEETRVVSGCSTKYGNKGTVCGFLASCPEVETPIPPGAEKVAYDPKKGSFNVEKSDAVLLTGSKGYAVNPRKE